jgi:membrane protein DedA with SNARE-associated domain
MKHLISNLISTYGYPGLFLLTIAETACIPVSSEIVLLFTGLLAATGHLSLPVAIIIALLGETVGGFIAWIIGRFGGRKLIEKYGKYVLIDIKDLERIENWFNKRGVWAIFLGRVLPFVRTFISLPAGTAEVPPLKFGLYSFFGSLIWIIAVTLIGYEVGKSAQNTVSTILSNAGYLLGILIVLLFIAFLIHRLRSRRHATD